MLIRLAISACTSQSNNEAPGAFRVMHRMPCRREPTPLEIFGPPGTHLLLRSSLFPPPVPLTFVAPELHISEWTLEGKGRAWEEQAGGFTCRLRTIPPNQAGPTGAPSTHGGKVRQFAHTRAVLLGIGGADAAGEWPQLPLMDGLSWSVPGCRGFVVQAAQLRHRVPCWGYVFQARRCCRCTDQCPSTAVCVQSAAQLLHIALRCLCVQDASVSVTTDAVIVLVVVWLPGRQRHMHGEGKARV
jgi:hypothetical protein